MIQMLPNLSTKTTNGSWWKIQVLPNLSTKTTDGSLVDDSNAA